MLVKLSIEVGCESVLGLGELLGLNVSPSSIDPEAGVASRKTNSRGAAAMIGFMAFSFGLSANTTTHRHLSSGS